MSTKRMRLCVDLNVYVAALLARRLGREDTASRRILEAFASDPSRTALVVSWGMLTRLRAVLTTKLGIPEVQADLYVRAIAGYAEAGAGTAGPLLTLGGTGVLPIRDVEDRHVLETALAGGADVLVTGNLKDFESLDVDIIAVDRVLSYRHATGRLLIAHPFTVAEWLRHGDFPEDPRVNVVRERAASYIRPAPGARQATLREVFTMLTRHGPDPEFAADLERVNRADQPPENPWDS